MNPDSEPIAGVTTPEFARFLKVRSFDLCTPDDGWKPVATMTFPLRFQPPCLVLDDKLYVLGGVSASCFAFCVLKIQKIKKMTIFNFERCVDCGGSNRL